MAIKKISVLGSQRFIIMYTKGHQQASSVRTVPLYSFLFSQIVLKNCSVSDCNYHPVAVYMTLLNTILGVPNAWRLCAVCTR
jgi:hypothetical protein